MAGRRGLRLRWQPGGRAAPLTTRGPRQRARHAAIRRKNLVADFRREVAGRTGAVGRAHGAGELSLDDRCNPSNAASPLYRRARRRWSRLSCASSCCRPGCAEQAERFDADAP